MTTLAYAATVRWTPAPGEATSAWAAYRRDFEVDVAGKPGLPGSADAHFRGDATRHNPEDLFLAAIASCHMLTWLALCARAGVTVLAYEDRAESSLRLGRDGGRFEEVVLRPVAILAPGADAALALALHEQAHAQCFIAASCAVPIRCRPEVRHGEAPLVATGLPAQP